MLDCLQLLHFHIGSQISSILTIKEVMREGSHTYCELARMGAPMVIPTLYTLFIVKWRCLLHSPSCILLSMFIYSYRVSLMWVEDWELIMMVPKVNHLLLPITVCR